ncbi:DoxX family protein [Gordonia sp. ABSL1-1]|uniref:DoxX family protein n=1 Tax=Gordonia sp. ABSL1-1 TaxID=3053923 RepID=UPI0025734390|nr:DoxX family protein [Gordonia sp. ABSL1-1]MDL9935417.1 DoxX family protein [Gordonia sp. ABSL1-1]
MLSSLEKYAPWAIGAYRIAIGILFCTHGTGVLWGWPNETPTSRPDLGAWPWWWAGLIEVVVGALLIVGLATRPAALIGSGAMAVAYFWKHQPDGLFPIENGGQGSALYCWALLLLVFVGSGRLALDSVVARRNTTTATPVVAVA